MRGNKRIPHIISAAFAYILINTGSVWRNMKQKLPKFFIIMLLFVCAFLVGRAGGRLAKRGLQKKTKTQMTESMKTETVEKESETSQESQSVRLPEGEGKGTVIVDPGHGGRDPGMVGIDELEEKGINLAISEKLADLLAEQGYRVVLTRSGDYGLYDEDASNKKAQDMQRRCALIEAEEPLLTVSIHQNSYSDPAVCGPQVFYYQHSAEGKELAALIQEQLNTQLKIARPREIKSNENYYILKRSPSVTALVECSFLSNPEEAAKIQTEEYQEALAGAICDGMLMYLEGEMAQSQGT